MSRTLPAKVSRDEIPAPGIERFNARTGKPDANGCRLWEGSIDRRTGQGVFKVLGRTKPASRLAYAIEHGEVPAGMYVRQTCRIPGCVAVEHLEVTTASNRQLAPDTVNEIISRYNAGGITQADLAEQYDVTPGEVSHLVNGRRYAPTPKETSDDADAARPAFQS